MTKLYNKLKKPCFWPILGPFFHFWGKKKFSPENLALSRTTSHGILTPCQNLEKINDTIPRKCPVRPKDGNLDRRTDRPFFIGPFRLPLGVQIYVFCDHNLLVLPLHKKRHRNGQILKILMVPILYFSKI